MTERETRGEFDDMPTAGPEHDGVWIVNRLGAVFQCIRLTDVFEEGDAHWVWQTVRTPRRDDEEDT